MYKLFLFFLLMPFMHLSAEVSVEKVYWQKDFAGYLVNTSFFRSILLVPGKSESDAMGPNVIRAGRFKSLQLKDSVNLLGKGKGPDGIMRYGLTQVFEPVGKLAPDQKDLILPGVGKGSVDGKGNLTITEAFPWKSSFSPVGDKKQKFKISFSQDADKNGKPLGYKMRIDCIFSDTAVVEIKGIFFNLSDKVLEAGISPTATFSNTSFQAKPWIVVPYQRARVVNNRRINYIDCSPNSVKELNEYYEFTGSRLSKAKRWVAVGGLMDKGSIAFMSMDVIQKVIFWKTGKCFSVYPYIKLKADPGERAEWTWKLFAGRGMESISHVTDQGMFGIKLERQPRQRRYKCKIQFLPSEVHDDLLMDVFLKSSRGSIISTKSYESYKISPLKPETIMMKLPSSVNAGKRYSIKFELLEKDEVFLNFEQWIYPE
jgi:hypothetical protein